MKNPISEFLQSRIEARDFPSAVYIVAEKGEIILQDALGLAVIEPEKLEAKIDTIYDLASLTKPLVIGLLFAKLVENGEINLEYIIQHYLPEFHYQSKFVTDDKWDTAICELLSHSSCFPAWKPFYLFSKNRENILEEIIKIPLEIDSVTVKYSDLNFLILTFLLERIYNKRIDEIAREEIFEPLNLQSTFYNPPKELQKRIAASEFGNEYEKQTCIEQGFDISNYSWRNYQIWGEVHDGNCYFMDGVSGHAGLFSTAEETFKIALQFLPEYTKILKPETCKLFRENFTRGSNEARSLAFELAENKDSTASQTLAKNSFGHLGFTGTSLWIQPRKKSFFGFEQQKDRIFILLTNRTHARELPFVNINSTRRRFHELAVEMLDKRGG